MAEQSIFHNVVKGETAYTQLLCNLLKRDKKFRRAFLDKIGLGGVIVNDSDIRAEVHLDGHGRADILIESSTVCVIVEIKTEKHRDKQPSQEITSEGNTYLSWLAAKGSHKRKVLIFILPRGWILMSDIMKKIEQFKKKQAYRINQISIPKPLLWGDIIKTLGQSNSFVAQEAISHFQKRFGPIGFSEKEKNLMFNNKFPIREVVKLVKLIDDLRDSLDGRNLDIQNEEFGFYLEKKGDKNCWLYVGCGPDVSTDKSHLIYFGVGPKVSERARKAFKTSLQRNYSQNVIEPDGEWLLGFIPKKDFDEADALSEIEPKFKAIWADMKKA